MARWGIYPLLLLLSLVEWIEAGCKESGFASGLTCSNCEELGKFNLGFLGEEVRKLFCYCNEEIRVY